MASGQSDGESTPETSDLICPVANPSMICVEMADDGNRELDAGYDLTAFDSQDQLQPGSACTGRQCLSNGAAGVMPQGGENHP